MRRRIRSLSPCDSSIVDVLRPAYELDLFLTHFRVRHSIRGLLGSWTTSPERASCERARYYTLVDAVVRSRLTVRDSAAGPIPLQTGPADHTSSAYTRRRGWRGSWHEQQPASAFPCPAGARRVGRWSRNTDEGRQSQRRRPVGA